VEDLNDFCEVYLPLILNSICLESAKPRLEAQAGIVIEPTEIINGIRRGDSAIDLWAGDQIRLPARNGLWTRT